MPFLVGEKVKKALIYILLAVVFVGGYFVYEEASKVLPFYEQLTQNRVGTEVDLRDDEQKKAHFVGAQKCAECHEENLVMDQHLYI